MFGLIISFIGFGELVVIMLVAIVIFGPKKLPEIARGLGEGVRKMKEATEDIKREIMNPVQDMNPIKEIKKTIEESKENLQNTAEEIEKSIDDHVGPVSRK